MISSINRKLRDGRDRSLVIHTMQALSTSRITGIIIIIFTNMLQVSGTSGLLPIMASLSLMFSVAIHIGISSMFIRVIN
jgi:hypothetical protein